MAVVSFLKTSNIKFYSSYVAVFSKFHLKFIVLVSQSASLPKIPPFQIENNRNKNNDPLYWKLKIFYFLHMWKISTGTTSELTFYSFIEWVKGNDYVANGFSNCISPLICTINQFFSRRNLYLHLILHVLIYYFISDIKI